MLLLRHAHAGERLSSPLLDRERPLDRTGRAHARALQPALAGQALERIVTSPHVRCVETVRPLARALGLELEFRDELAPDATRRGTMALLDELPEASLVCTHREVIERLLHGEVECEKGAAWLVERSGRHWRPVAYLPPPAIAERARRRAAMV